jgi:predicted RNA-binding Zn-ribbon protein involved in translation (DUF1610 family)
MEEGYLQCVDCEHKWFPRSGVPAKCPNCGALANSRKYGKRGNPNFVKRIDLDIDSSKPSAENG